jgi:predicted HTH transcriptional regulator
MKQIFDRIDAGESETLDFKKTITSVHKIAKTMCSFSNHKGGSLLVGITDQGTVAGVREMEEKHMLELAAAFYCKPEIKLDFRQWTLQGKTILEAIIPEGKSKPYYAKGEDNKWWVYIRVKDKSVLASKIVVEVLRKKTQEESAFIAYSRHEQGLLKLLDRDEKLTLKEICKKLNLSRRRTQQMLITFINAGVIRNHTTEKTEFYTLS